MTIQRFTITDVRLEVDPDQRAADLVFCLPADGGHGDVELLRLDVTGRLDRTAKQALSSRLEPLQERRDLSG